MPDHRLRRRVPFLLGLAAPLSLLSACAPHATLITDPVFAELYLSDREEVVRLEDAAQEAGFRLRTVTLESVAEGPAAVDAALDGVGSGDPTVLSPLLPAVARGADRARTLGGGDLLLLGGPDDEPPEGASVAVYDRTAAFAELGQRIGGRSVVAFFRSDTPTRRAELDAFREGLGAAVERTRFVVFDEEPPDTAVREELFRVRSPEVDLVAVFLGPANRLVLNEIAGMERSPPPVATEDLGPADAYGSFVAYRVERDYAAALGAFLSGRRGRIRSEARLIERGIEPRDRVP
ncbi:MAG: hypothetical protein ACLFPO_04200 [Spirochaetaceae bacterium]